MKTMLHLTLAAGGSPSVVKGRIGDQAAALSGTSPEQSAAITAARLFIEKSLDGVSEDDTLTVSATITINVTDMPAVLAQQKASTAAAETAAAATDTKAPTTSGINPLATSEAAPVTGVQSNG